MTHFQFYLLAQAYGSGVYGGEAYQCSGSECETKTGQPSVTTPPSTGIFKQENMVGVGIVAAILALSIIVALVAAFVRKRSHSKK